MRGGEEEDEGEGEMGRGRGGEERGEVGKRYEGRRDSGVIALASVGVFLV